MTAATGPRGKPRAGASTAVRARSAPIRLADRELRNPGHVGGLFSGEAESYAVLTPFIVDGLERGERAVHIVAPAERASHLERLASANEHFEIVFLDPPYESDLVNATLARLGAGTITLPGSMVIAQHFTKQEVRDAVGVLERSRTRRFGETTLSYYQHRGERSAAPPRDPPPDRSEKDCEPSDSSPRA